MLHFMLPDSKLDANKSRLRPCMFADTGLNMLFEAACNLGAAKNRTRVRIAGGAQLLDAQGIFNIGKRNYAAVRKLLWKAGIMIQAEDVGGNSSRTVRLDVATGQTWIRATSTGEEPKGAVLSRNGGQEWQLMC
jgi:chemotaxis protein CheD